MVGKALEYHDSALSENTRRAYQRGWKDFRSFCREHGFETVPATEQAPPLLTEHIKDMVDALPGYGKPPKGTEAKAAWLRGKRDRALILTGFTGAFRRSELASFRTEHIDGRPSGLFVTIPESKTDQEGKGQLVAIRRIEGSSYCPVKALRKWTTSTQIEEGAIFRGVPQSGYVSRDAITGRKVGTP
ncbi:hypothetical protein [Salinibacter sp.]|uniref:hypothetical protein n=1 Tax=Salinibacter sp. TaxID=2065818 RepID=UPI0021E7DA5A|nr:hypothetical protein [Salinibacter sp.]